MDKEITLDLINALKTLKDITLRQNEIIRDYLDIQSKLTIKQFQYQHNRFTNITRDINSLMAIKLNRIELTKYYIDSNAEINELYQEWNEINKELKKIVEEFKLSHKDLQEKIMDFDYILEEIENKLKK